MKRKHKILMTMTAILFLLLSAIPADTKGMEETAVWDITRNWGRTIFSKQRGNGSRSERILYKR